MTSAITCNESQMKTLKSLFGKEINQSDSFGLKLEVKLERINIGTDTRHIMFSKNKLPVNEICEITSILHENKPDIAVDLLKEKGYDFNLNPMATSCRAIELV